MSLIKSTLSFASGTLFSRLSGVVRESVVGALFGATVGMDAFVIAFRIPNLLRELLAEGALGSSFTKVYSSLRVSDEKRAHALLQNTLFLLTLVMLVITAAGIFFAEDLVRLMTALDQKPTAPTLALAASRLTALMFPFIMFAALGAVAMGVLQEKGKFFLIGISPIAFNVMNVVFALCGGTLLLWCGAAPETFASWGGAGIVGLSLGVLLGGFLQMLVVLLPALRTLPQGAWQHLKIWSPDIKKVFILMTPMMIAGSAGQINNVVNTNYAASLPEGSVSWIYYAFRLVQLPIGLFGVAIASAALPRMAKAIAARDHDPLASVQEFRDALLLVLWLMVPSAVFLFTASLPVTRLLYEMGRFSFTDSQATAQIISAYALGLWAYGVIKVLTSYYYASDRTNFAMTVSLLTIFINFAANHFFVHRLGAPGLALASSLTLSLNALILFAGSKQVKAVAFDAKTRQSLLTLFVAMFLALPILFISHQFFVPFLQWPGLWQTKLWSAAEAALLGAVTVVIFGLSYCWTSGISPNAMLQKVSGRFKKRR